MYEYENDSEYYMASEKRWLQMFASNLRELMIDRDISQKELADRCHVRQSTISKYLSEQQMPSMKAIVNMSAVLRVRTDALIWFDVVIE